MDRRSLLCSSLALAGLGAVGGMDASPTDPAVEFARRHQGDEFVPAMWIKSKDGRWMVVNHITKRGWIQGNRGREWPCETIADYRTEL